MSRSWGDGEIAELSRWAEVDASAPALAAGGADFGGLVRGTARGVARPGSTGAIAEIVGFAHRSHLPLVPRGGAYSQSGQSIPLDGVVLDLKRMNRVGAPDRERLTVVTEAGATWRDLLRVTLPLGLAPRVAPLNLDLTVGGTLSAGGMGSTSHRHGLAVSNVVSAEVVLGTGEVVRCGPGRERRVFDAVLGGLGRCGVITSVEHALEPVAPKVRTFFLLYEDLGVLLADQALLAARAGVHHLEAFCSASVQGLRVGPGGRRQPLRHWLYGLHVSAWHHGDPEPPATELLAGLRFGRMLHEEDDDVGPFASRYDVRFEGMKAMGAWAQPHPWFEVLLPPAAAVDVIRAALELPAFLGDGHRITFVADRDRPAAVAVPGAGPTVIFAVLPAGVPEPLVPPALAALEGLQRAADAVGGKRYLSGWLFERSVAGWKAHYGADYDLLVAAKRALDPHDVFRSRLGPLA